MTNRFDEENHKYFIDDKEYPSVTDICSPIAFQRLDAISKGVLDQARQRGTRVHEIIEEYLLLDGVDFDLIESEYLPYIVSFDEWQRTYRPKVLFTEKQLFSANLGYCGTCDLLCEIDNQLTLIDYKATSSLDTKSLSVQLAGYSNLLKEQYGYESIKTMALHLKKDTYVFKEITPNFEWFEILKKHNEFMRLKNGKRK